MNLNSGSFPADIDCMSLNNLYNSLVAEKDSFLSQMLTILEDNVK